MPVEAQACGTPVVALAQGGALETVVDGVTGVFFAESSADALADALERLGGMRIDARRVRDNALRFSRARFVGAFQALIEESVAHPPHARW